MTTQLVENRGIYHALPTYSHDLHSLTAVITGANGLCGRAMLQVLVQNPTRWKKIYCLSRRSPALGTQVAANVQHIKIDFLSSPEKIADTLSSNKVEADYIFFFSYAQPPPKVPSHGIWSNFEELLRVNSLMLKNFLSALKMANIAPKRFMLQTGAKNYGGHLGPTKAPQEEKDPRHGFQPNFYYTQEDMLYEYCAAESVGWNICMPGPVLGSVRDSSMNIALPLAIYASICKELGTTFEWTSDEFAWQASQTMSSGILNAYMEEWVVLTPGTKNERFNVADSSMFTWEACWPCIAAWFGIEWSGPKESSAWLETVSATNHRPYGSNSINRRRIAMVDWIRREDIELAWGRLVRKHDLIDAGSLTDMFAFYDTLMARSQSLNLSMDKARVFGWNGFVSSTDSLKTVFADFAGLRLIPPF